MIFQKDLLSDGFLDSSLAGGNVSLAFGAWLDSFAPVVFASSPAPLQAAKESTKALAISREKSFVSFVFI